MHFQVSSLAIAPISWNPSMGLLGEPGWPFWLLPVLGIGLYPGGAGVTGLDAYQASLGGGFSLESHTACFSAHVLEFMWIVFHIGFNPSF